MQSLVDTPPEDFVSKQSTPIADQDTYNGIDSPGPAVLKPSQRPNLMDEWDNQPVGARSGWEQIRELDDAENWEERTRVVTKQDHCLYTECAKDFVEELVDSMPMSEEDPGRLASYSPDIANTEQHSSNVSTIQQAESEGPLPRGGGEFDYMKEFTDSDFQSSAAQFDVDLLEKITTSSSAVPDALTRESLYVKFDPLVGASSHTERTTNAHPSIPLATAVSTTAQQDFGDNLLMLNTPPKQTQNSAVKNDAAQMSSSSSLSSQSSLPKATLPARTLLDSSPTSFPLDTRQASPPPTTQPILSEGSPSDELIKVPKDTEQDVAKLIQNARHDKETEAVEEVTVLREESLATEAKLQKKVDRLVKELQKMRASVSLSNLETSSFQKEIARLDELCSKHAETETTILNHYEELKTKTREVEKQRDQILTDFESLEKSFAEFHQRYIKSKEIVQAYQQNEAKLQQYISDLESQLQRAEEQNQQLQQETQGVLQEANETYEKIRKESSADVAVMKANEKKLMLQIASQERALQQERQEKAELTQLCEDLMKELQNKH